MVSFYWASDEKRTLRVTLNDEAYLVMPSSETGNRDKDSTSWKWERDGRQYRLQLQVIDMGGGKSDG
jgi:hypothetical protein